MPRWPAIEIWPRWGSTCTVGVTSAKSWKRRPLMGRSWRARRSTTREAAGATLTRVSPTSTRVVVEATWSLMSALTVEPTLSTNPETAVAAKPGAWAVTS